MRKVKSYKMLTCRGHAWGEHDMLRVLWSRMIWIVILFGVLSILHGSGAGLVPIPLRLRCFSSLVGDVGVPKGESPCVACGTPGVSQGSATLNQSQEDLVRLRCYDGMGAAAAARQGLDRWGYADVTTETAGTEGTHNADAGATDEYENENLNV